MKYCKAAFLLVFLVLYLLTFSAFAADIEIGNGTYNTDNDTISFSLILTAGTGEEIAGVNLEIHYSSNISVLGVTAGQAATDAGKEVVHNSPSSAVLRMVIYGINQNLISNGTLANLTFAVTDSSQENVEIEIASAVAASSDALAVTVSSMKGFTGTFTDLPTSDGSTNDTSSGGDSGSGGCFISNMDACF